MKKNEIILKGIPASPGIAIGKAFLFDSEQYVITKRRIDKKDVEKEFRRFKNALKKTKEEIVEIKRRISKEIGIEHAQIFSAHLLVIEDSMLIEDVVSKLREDMICIEYVFQDVLKRYIRIFSEMDDEYLRERISDINDVGKRVLRNLIGAKRDTLRDLKQKAMVVAYDLSPSDTATMHKQNVTAFVTDIGGRTSHTAIMAKSLEIPAVVGLEIITSQVKSNDTMIVDGTHGTVIVHPTERTLKKYTQEKKQLEVFEHHLLELRDLPCQTLDGKSIVLAANIELPDDLPSVLNHGAAGVGLYRTEYLFMNRRTLPTEEEQLKAYRSAVEGVKPNPVVIRTLDLGGDKFLSQFEVAKEMNPFLGWRAIRFCLAKPDIFKVQLRAILRASAYGDIKVMYPMISGVEELREANRILDEVRKELRGKSIPFNETMDIGVMIEVPSAALISDVLAKEVKFFSIGTNDLIQYLLAVDRVNEKIAYLYEPSHPAVLRLIKRVIDNGHKAGVWVGMCGEMASDITMTPILLGLGLDEFSMSPIAVPEVKRVIRAVTMQQAREIAEKSLEFSTGAEVELFARRKIQEIVPDMAIELG
ncbi:MAG: phosphoenolpyruvate--protein phosphotransferase [Candidatus Omnitrophota bacterium]